MFDLSVTYIIKLCFFYRIILRTELILGKRSRTDIESIEVSS